MNEEEIIEKYHHFKIKTADGIELDLIETKYYKELLDLYKQTKKELDSLKEIEKSHQEENGKLRVELKQKEEVIKKLEQDVEGYRDLSKQIQEDYSKQIRDYEEGYNE